MTTLTIHVNQSGVDYSDARPDPNDLYRRGVRFASRYLTATKDMAKVVSRAEIDGLFKAGIAVMLNAEDYETLMLTVAPSTVIGRANAWVAAARALRAPDGACIVVSHDTSSWNGYVVPNYQNAYNIIRAAGFTMGVYAGKSCVDALLAAGIPLACIWAPGATGWLGGRHPQAHIWQGPVGPNTDLTGLNVDGNCCKRDIALWYEGLTPDIPTPPPTPPTPTPIPSQEDEMPQTTLYRSATRQVIVLADGAGVTCIESAGIPGTDWDNTCIMYGDGVKNFPRTVGLVNGGPPCSEATIDYHLNKEKSKVGAASTGGGTAAPAPSKFTGQIVGQLS